jgi:hypothetical protein
MLPEKLEFSLQSPTPRPALSDLTVAASCLRHSVRRGDCDVASSAVEAIWTAATHRLSRLLVRIAVSDIGIASPALLHRVISFVERGTRSWTRLEALKVVGDMALSPKCTAAADLVQIAYHSPRVARVRRETAEMDAHARVSFVLERRGSLFEEAVAACFLARGMAIKARARSTPASRRRFFAHCQEREENTGGVALAERAFLLTRGTEAVALALIAGARPEEGELLEVDRVAAADTAVGGVPTYAFDQHTLVGAWALTLAARKDREVKDWLKARVRFWEWHLSSLAYLLLRVEGSEVAHWAPSQIAQKVRQVRDSGHEFIRREHLEEGVALMRSKISVINELRQSAYDMRFAETK